MYSNSTNMRFFETIHKLKQLNIHEELKTMPKSEFYILGNLLKKQKNNSNTEIRVCEIAQDLNISAPAVSRTLKHLEKKEYIQRIIDKEDRRNTHVKITKKGEDAIYTDMRTIRNFMDNALEHLNHEEIEQLIILINKLYSGMQNELNQIDNTDNIY